MKKKECSWTYESPTTNLYSFLVYFLSFAGKQMLTRKKNTFKINWKRRKPITSIADSLHWGTGSIRIKVKKRKKKKTEVLAELCHLLFARQLIVLQALPATTTWNSDLSLFLSYLNSFSKITCENVCCNIPKRQVKLFGMHCFTKMMFFTALCVIFLVKSQLDWTR